MNAVPLWMVQMTDGQLAARGVACSRAQNRSRKFCPLGKCILHFQPMLAQTHMPGLLRETSSHVRGQVKHSSDLWNIAVEAARDVPILINQYVQTASMYFN